MTTVEIRSEPRTYSPGVDHSFFIDLALATVNEPGSDEARARQARHRVEVDGEIRAGSPEGRRARQVRAREQRVGATSTTIAGFTTPQYLTDLYAGYRTQQRTFADCTELHDLPGTGLQINVPSFTSGTPAGQQSENSGIDTAVPTGANIAKTVVTITDAVPVSQQLYDRGGMSGLSFDQILLQQIKMGIDSQLDTYVITQITGGITAAANTITDNSGFSIAQFYADVATARESLADLAGTRLKATHIFSLTDAFSYVTDRVDDDHRPIVTPDWAAGPIILAPGDDAGDGWTGHVLPGKIAWFTDDNIPNASGNYQILVSRPSSVLTFESDIIPFAYPETNATTLTVYVGVRKYAAAVARFPNAHTIITGSAYVNTEI